MTVGNLPQVLRPFEAWEALTIAQAARIAGRSVDTVRRWAALFDIGRPVGGSRVTGGQWMVSRIALYMHLDGDQAALSAYLTGDRTGAAVAVYVDRAKKDAAKNAKAANAA